MISAIRSGSGKTYTDPVRINEIFDTFYADLYTSGCPPIRNNLLNGTPFPQIESEAARDQEGLIIVTEVQEAIKSLQSGEPPVPDGFTAEYYKTFSGLFATVLKTRTMRHFDIAVYHIPCRGPLFL